MNLSISIWLRSFTSSINFHHIQNLHSLNRFCCSISTDWNQPEQRLHSYQGEKRKKCHLCTEKCLGNNYTDEIWVKYFFFNLLCWHHCCKSFVCILWQSNKCILVTQPLLQSYHYSCCLAAFSEAERLPHLSPAVSSLLSLFVSSNNPAVIKNAIALTSLTRELRLVFCHTGSKDNRLALLVSVEEFMSF